MVIRVLPEQLVHQIAAGESSATRVEITSRREQPRCRSAWSRSMLKVRRSLWRGATTARGIAADSLPLLRAHEQRRSALAEDPSRARSTSRGRCQTRGVALADVASCSLAGRYDRHGSE
jgi:hypothetical protein